jgi:hypothetical protein
VTDGLKGMSEALAAVYPATRSRPASSIRVATASTSPPGSCQDLSAALRMRFAEESGRVIRQGPAKAHELLRRDVWSGLKPLPQSVIEPP